MNIQEASKFIGQYRRWVMDRPKRDPIVIIVFCHKVTGLAVADHSGQHYPADMVHCTYQDRGTRAENVWFTPERFLEMPLIPNPPSKRP